MRSRELIAEFFSKDRETREDSAATKARVKYDRGVLYSYRYTFPIAAICGSRAYLLDPIESVSNTTSKHIREARTSATNQDYTIQIVSMPELHDAITEIRESQRA